MLPCSPIFYNQVSSPPFFSPLLCWYVSAILFPNDPSTTCLWCDTPNFVCLRLPFPHPVPLFSTNFSCKVGRPAGPSSRWPKRFHFLTPFCDQRKSFSFPLGLSFGNPVHYPRGFNPQFLLGSRARTICLQLPRPPPPPPPFYFFILRSLLPISLQDSLRDIASCLPRMPLQDPPPLFVPLLFRIRPTPAC